MAKERQYWILVSSLENWHKTAEHDFTVQGIKSRHRKKADQMKPGDKFIYYCTGVKSFAGITTVKSTVFEDHSPIWLSGNKKKKDEDYPYRFEIEGDLALGDDDLVPAEPPGAADDLCLEVAAGALDVGLPGERSQCPRGGLRAHPFRA